MTSLEGAGGKAYASVTVLKNAAQRLGWGDDWPTIQKNWFEKILHDHNGNA